MQPPRAFRRSDTLPLSEHAVEIPGIFEAETVRHQGNGFSTADVRLRHLHMAARHIRMAQNPGDNNAPN